MKDRKHLRLVKTLERDADRRSLGLLDGPPWSWFALVAATVVTPAIQSVTNLLRAYEAENSAASIEPSNDKSFGQSHS
jgi:hypothetical protein